MASHSISRSGNTVTINAYSATFSRQFVTFVTNNILRIQTIDNAFTVSIDMGVDTVTVNGNSFPGTAAELRAVVANEVFYFWVDGSLPYLEYICILSQVGTNAPTAEVIKNTLGGDVTWSRDVAGSYTGLLPDAFTVGKTFAPPFGGYQNNNTWLQISGGGYYSVQPSNDPSYFQLLVATDTAYTEVDLSAIPGNKLYVEIRVYP